MTPKRTFRRVAVAPLTDTDPYALINRQRAAGGLTGMIALLGAARSERAEAQKKKKKTQAEVAY
jgi:hypothetical protein